MGHRTESRKWWALLVLCMGALMIVLDTTIVNVALPSIRASLGFSESSLAWVINAYTLTFGGFLLLGGRLGDLYGPRRLFLFGIGLFTLASFCSGISTSQEMLIIARAVQGLGGAIASAVALSLMMNLFQEEGERAKAMGVYGFVAAGGGSLGVLLGGVLTAALDWHWIFLVNIPIGIAVSIASLYLLDGGKAETKHKHLDVWGAVAITASLLIATYAIVNGSQAGWVSAQTLGLLLAALAGIILFIGIEARVRSPLMPLSVFRVRNVAIASFIGVLWSASMFAWFFLSALSMQLVLGYSPMQVGLAFLPGNAIMAILSLGLSARIVMYFGIKRSLSAGLFFVAGGLALFAFAPVGGTFIVNILPGMILLGLGAGIALNPMLLAAMNDVPQDESGLVSGVVNTAFMMGGALGLAVLASVAASHTQGLALAGADHLTALSGGYNAAFLVGAVFSLLAALLAGFGLRISKKSHKAVLHF